MLAVAPAVFALQERHAGQTDSVSLKAVNPNAKARSAAGMNVVVRVALVLMVRSATRRVRAKS